MKWMRLGLFISVSLLFWSCSVADSKKESDEDGEGIDVHIDPGELLVTDHLSSNGITFYFDDEYTAGTFANGDFWVRGPVVIERITPDFDGEHHGWQVNPMPGHVQAFDARMERGGGEFNPDLLPSLPYEAIPGASVVKTVSRIPAVDPIRPHLQKAAVLTVLDEIPPGNGAEVFRPPYAGTEKPFYFVRDIRADLLPRLTAVDPMPSLATVTEWFTLVQMDHIGGSNSQYGRPADHLPFYAADVGRRTADAALRLMVEGPEEDRLKALIAYLQCGLDYYHFIRNDYFWPRGGGEQPGHKLPITFFVTLLGDQEMKDFVAETLLYEDYTVVEGQNSIALWGHWGWPGGGAYDSGALERSYWNNIAYGSGSRTNKDPYGYIDGGQVPGGWYQFCCTSQPFKGSVLSLLLMPELREVWNPETLISYVDRWVHFGTWSLPDPCAAPNGDTEEEIRSNYMITWGPDPDHPGSCIKGKGGRFPDKHGTFKDEGYRKSAFQSAMWDTYRSDAFGASSTMPQVAVIYPENHRPVSGTVTLAASAYSIHGVQSVQFYVNGSPYGDPVRAPSNTPPIAYQLDFDASDLRDEVNVIKAAVMDQRGNRVTSEAVYVTYPSQSGLR
ncbi:Ig-like domain-containing protein [Balneolaceae bacterium ANBcel3]|nr:Ig-like domain-containing protein [Balneolaceae bacterium ANBcel3]